MDQKEALELKKRVQGCKDLNMRLRLNSVYLHYIGNSVSKIGEILCISSSTVSNYIREYEDNGKDRNLPRGGKEERLEAKQALELSEHLQQKTYLKVFEIIEYVAQKYQIMYTASGMKDWLKRHGFVYKKPKVTPAKLDYLKQEEFAKSYYEMRSKQSQDEVTIFIDGVHPAHQTQAVHGWIKKGEEVAIKTTAKQFRIHYMGALDIDNVGCPLLNSYTTIDSEAVIDFCQKIKDKYVNKKKITIISDNAGYHKGKKMRKFLEENPLIEMVYLPPYSPNLNPIERLWKIMREHVVYNKYYLNFNDFKVAVSNFFDKTIPTIQSKMLSRINDNFQVIIPKFIHL